MQRKRLVVALEAEVEQFGRVHDLRGFGPAISIQPFASQEFFASVARIESSRDPLVKFSSNREVPSRFEFIRNSLEASP